MAKNLKGLVVKKIDFVDSGANPEANVMIYKRADKKNKLEDEDEMDISIDDDELYDDEEYIEADVDMDIDTEDVYEDEDEEQERKGVKKALNEIAKALGFIAQEENRDLDYENIEKAEELMDDIQKKARYFKEFSEEAKLEDVLSAIRMNNYGMSESMHSILTDNDISDKEEALLKNLDDYYAITKEQISLWATGKVSTQVAKSIEEVNPEYQDVFKSAKAWLEEQIQKSEVKEDKKMIDVTKMSKEDREAYDALVAKYASEETKVEKAANSEDVYKGINPAVKQEIEELKKFKARKEDEEMLQVAKRYEVIGKKAEVFAPILKSLKATDENVYNETIASLDAAVSAVEKSDIFKSIGSGMSGAKEEGWDAIAKSANKIRENNPEMTYAQAIVKAGEENPEALATYEASRR